MKYINIVKYFKVVYLPCFFNLFLLFFSSCSHQQISGDLIPQGGLNLEFKEQFNFSDLQDLKIQIKKIGSLDGQQNQDKLVRILIAFQNLTKNRKENEIRLLPHAKTKIALSSFCGSANKAIPEPNEIFKWVKGDPNIPLARPVLKFYSQSPLKNQEVIQELIWNLGNKTYYEDYPEELKNILNEAMPSAKLTLPSRLKNSVISRVLPDEIVDSLKLIEGQYYSLKEFKSNLESKKSQIKLSSKYIASKVPSTPILASTESNGYTSQTITFYNPTDKTESIKLMDLYLQPVREDVQPIVMASMMPNLGEIQKLLEEASLKMLGYLGSQYPTLNPNEKHLVQEKPIQAAIAFYYAQVAENKEKLFFPGSSQNGQGDAFRHYVWSGLLVRDLGESEAREFLQAHEMTNGQPKAEREMDSFNNEMGVSAAINLLKKGNFEDSELFTRAVKEIIHGDLKILTPNSK